MTDSQQRSPGDTGYDPFSDPSNPQYGQPSQSADPYAGGGASTTTSQNNWQTNPYLSQIGGWFKQFTGKDPTYADVSQWGTGGFDQNYLNSIQNAVYNSNDAQTYRNASNAPPPTTTTTTAPAGPDYSNPAGQLSAVTGWLQAGGFGGDDPNYWVSRINQTGGFTPENLDYWQKRIAAGPSGGQPGGAYYDPGAAGLASPPVGGQNPLPADASNNLFNTLLQRSQQSLAISPNDPNIKTQTNAYNVQNERAKNQYLSQLAEKGSGGAGAPNIGAETRSADETAGRNSSNFAASLVGTELQQRRDEIQSALSQMGGMLSGNQQLAMQQELAQLNNALEQQKINSTNDQFAANFGLSAAEQAFLQNWMQSGGQG